MNSSVKSLVPIVTVVADLSTVEVSSVVASSPLRWSCRVLVVAAARGEGQHERAET